MPCGVVGNTGVSETLIFGSNPNVAVLMSNGVIVAQVALNHLA